MSCWSDALRILWMAEKGLRNIWLRLAKASRNEALPCRQCGICHKLCKFMGQNSQ